MSFGDFLLSNLEQFWQLTGFANAEIGNFAMLAVGLFFIWLAINKNFEPMLLVPIGFVKSAFTKKARFSIFSTTACRPVGILR